MTQRKKPITLKEARKHTRNSQQKVAFAVGIERKHYQNIEYGKVVPSVKIALKICNFLHCSVYDILEWKEDEK